MRGRLNRPLISETTNSIRKIKNSTCAIDAAPLAIPPNPKIAAIIAMTKNTAAQ